MRKPCQPAHVLRKRCLARLLRDLSPARARGAGWGSRPLAPRLPGIYGHRVIQPSPYPLAHAGEGKDKERNMTDIHTLPATELVALYRAKKLSPVEATRVALGRIEALDKTYNAFCLVDAEGALAAAKASEQR